MTDGTHDGIDWSLAAPVAARVAGTYSLADTYHTIQLRRSMPGVVGQAAAMVGEETGLETPGDPEVLVVTRAEWANRNLATFAHLLAPLESKIAEKLEETGSGGVPAAVARRVVAIETGALLGFLARRVLGQYELVLPTGDQGDVVAVVGANVLGLERHQQFKPADFRLWIALHEATHRAQFLGVPWLRGYFLNLVTDLVGSVTPSPGRIARLVAEVVEAGRKGRPLLDDTGLLGLLATPEQRQAIDRVQALMSLLEGHGHVVMDRIGARILPTQERMSSILKARRKDPRTAAFFRLTGMEMKMRQYELGEKFIAAIEAKAGWSTLDRAWLGPEWLPTLAEIEQPEQWLQRAA
ncbi:MAG: zinc-dependent metalloprotease [Acidimicrobiia bacterium]